MGGQNYFNLMRYYHGRPLSRNFMQIEDLKVVIKKLAGDSDVRRYSVSQALSCHLNNFPES